MKKFFLFPLGVFLLLAMLSFFGGNPSSANLVEIVQNIGGYTDLPVPQINGEPTAEGKIVRIIGIAIQIILLLAGSVSTVLIVIGAVRLTISSGDDDMVSGGKKIIIWAVIGLVVVIFSYAILVNVLDFLFSPDTRGSHIKA